MYRQVQAPIKEVNHRLPAVGLFVSQWQENAGNKIAQLETGGTVSQTELMLFVTALQESLDHLQRDVREIRKNMEIIENLLTEPVS